MKYCDFKTLWYGTIWIPSLLYFYLSLNAYCHKKFKFLSKKFCCFTAFTMSVLLRIIWFFDFTGCINLFTPLASNILLRFPQLVWLDLYTTLMLIWDIRLNSTILGDRINKKMHLMTAILTIIANIIVIILVCLEEFVANNIFFMVWTIFLLATGIYLGLITIKILKQLMPLETNQDDTRNVMLQKTKKILLATFLATTLLLVCNIIRYVAHWYQGQIEYLIFVLLIHLICEPIIVYTQYYAFFF